MNLLQTAHKAWAKFFGFFWLPCSGCGRYFGGHQWRRCGTIYPDGKGTCETRWSRGEMVCPHCTRNGIPGYEVERLGDWRAWL